MWPAVWPGTSSTWKRRPSASTLSPSEQALQRLGMRSRAGPYTVRAGGLAQRVDAAGVVGMVVRD